MWSSVEVIDSIALVVILFWRKWLNGKSMPNNLSCVTPGFTSLCRNSNVAICSLHFCIFLSLSFAVCRREWAAVSYFYTSNLFKPWFLFNQLLFENWRVWSERVGDVGHHVLKRSNLFTVNHCVEWKQTSCWLGENVSLRMFLKPSYGLRWRGTAVF